MNQNNPKTKEDYEEWLAAAMEIVHSKETRGAVQSILKSGGNDPVAATTEVLMLILHKMDEATAGAGEDIDDGVKLFALAEVVSQIAEIAEASGAFALDQDHQELALSVAVETYVKEEVAAGRIDPAELQRTMAAGVAGMSPKDRMMMEESVQRLAKTSKAYAARGGEQPAMPQEQPEV